MAIQIFLSYSHKDYKYLRKDALVDILKKRLRGDAEFWHDSKIVTGDMWNDEIIRNIDKSRIIVALISQSFLQSHYCTKVEIKRFLANAKKKKGLVIFPIVLSPCRWKAFNWLKVRQYIPTGDKTIEKNFSTTGLRKKLYDKIVSDLRIQTKRAADLETNAFKRLSSGINMINKMDPVINAVIKGGPVKKEKHGLMFKGKKDEMIAMKNSQVKVRIRFDQFRERLNSADLKYIMIYDKRINIQYIAWVKLDAKRYSPQTGALNKNIDTQQKQLIREMRNNLLKIIGYLQNVGFELDDHYSQLRDLLRNFK